MTSSDFVSLETKPVGVQVVLVTHIKMPVSLANFVKQELRNLEIVTDELDFGKMDLTL